ncbi:MAG: ATP-binding protein [Deltaproteobacteria bacterium]|nr:ATP-binding protein [Deltaproteobacteria bacterium]
MSLADELQIWGFEGDYLIFSDGSFGFALELSPLDVSTRDDHEIDSLACRLVVFLNGLSEEMDIQFVQEIEAGNETVILKNESLCHESVSETVRALHEDRLAHLRKLDGLGLIARHSLKLFVRRKPVASLFQKPRIFGRPKLFEKIAEDSLERELTVTVQLKEEIIRGLDCLGIKSRPISERAVAELIYRQWNPTRDIGLGNYDPEDIRFSLLFTDVGIYNSGFLLGDMHYRVISLKCLPTQTYASMGKGMRELPFDSKLFLSIHVPVQQKELESLQLQRRLAFSMARGKRVGVSDIESEAKFQDLESLLNEMVAQGEKVFAVSLNILLRSQNEEELKNLVSQTLAKVREIGAEAMQETLPCFDIFCELAIPNARAKERAKRLKSSNLADFLPVYGPWQGHEEPRVLLRSHMGSLVGFDPFSRELANFNQIVTGGSGSGKSFLTNILLLQMLKENPQVFIVDIGGSYKKLCENLSGQYVLFNIDSGLSLNPFDLLTGEAGPSDHKVKFLVGLIEMMTKEQGDSGLGRLERAQIEEAIQNVYKCHKNPRLSDLRKILLEDKAVELNRLGKILGPWCGDTPYGKLIDRDTTIELCRPVVCFDLKGLETFPDLQAIALYLITEHIWREVQKDRQRLKFLILDECWKLLETASAFIAEVFRTSRKYLWGIIGISQNIDDFAKSKIASAILPNTSIKWVLKQKGADQTRLKEVLQLNEREMAAIASLHQQRGVYSQAFLMVEDTHCLVTVEPTALEYWVATSDARDIGHFDEETKKHPSKSQLEILKELSQKYPRGVASGGEGT